MPRVRDVLRDRRDQYWLSDPYVHLWLTVISRNRLALGNGAADRVWERIQSTTWPTQIAGPRWETVVRSYVAAHMFDLFGLRATSVGVTTISDRAEKTSHPVDLVVTDGSNVLAIGESKLRRLTLSDYQRLDNIRTLLTDNRPASKPPITAACSESTDSARVEVRTGDRSHPDQ